MGGPSGGRRGYVSTTQGGRAQKTPYLAFWRGETLVPTLPDTRGLTYKEPTPTRTVGSQGSPVLV